MSLTSFTVMIEDIHAHGERAAIMLQHFRYSLNSIKNGGGNKRRGLYWYKAPFSYLVKQFPWLTDSQIKTTLKNLEKAALYCEINPRKAMTKRYGLQCQMSTITTLKRALMEIKFQVAQPVENSIPAVQKKPQPLKSLICQKSHMDQIKIANVIKTY